MKHKNTKADNDTSPAKLLKSEQRLTYWPEWKKPGVIVKYV